MKKNYNLLLVNPWIYDFTAYDFWSKPLGLLYIASILRERGYEISYIDCMDRYNREILKLKNREFPKKDEFGRGPFYKEEVEKPAILKNIPCRYSRYGITEEIFLNKLKKLPPPQAVLVTSIMTYWYPGAFRVIEIIKKIFPDIPIILGGIYATLCFEHACKFSGADYVIKGNSIRDLIKILEIKDFIFYDDALLINSEDNFLIILEELIIKKLGIRLHTPNGIHARMINKEIACKMYQAGVETIRLGFETVDPRVQSETGGKITNIEFKKAVNCLLEAGFKRTQIGAYLLIGLPGQDIQEIIASIYFVIDCGAHPRLAKFSAIPGTKVWNEARAYFNLKGEVDPLFHNDALLPYLSPDITIKVYQQIKSIAKI
ncbi:radical SAM protein [Candidatus Atribacteria bacterium 4572_76]|nr:MAG: radical SAM protein [Candidatus Atribacteria bacterium 4572_76]